MEVAAYFISSKWIIYDIKYLRGLKYFTFIISTFIIISIHVNALSLACKGNHRIYGDFVTIHFRSPSNWAVKSAFCDLSF